jgi:hydroxymethylbilane synthase
MTIKIGTRGSKLALWQAEYISQKLLQSGLKTEIIIIDTKGDKILDKALSKIGSKGVFTEELEEQLYSGQIDIAVHSAKDLQSDLGSGLSIIAFTEREKINDVLISNSQIDFNQNSDIIIGTSSTRRVAMLKAYFPKVRITDMRGNLQTRIKKMEQGHCDALLLAFAGVNRMNYNELIRYEFDAEKFVPPVGQGTVAIEVADRLSKEKKVLIRKICNDPKTEKCLLAERAFLKTMRGGCSIPVFGNAILNKNQIKMNAGIISLDGKKQIYETLTMNADRPEDLGTKLAEIILKKGGREILNEIRNLI